MMPPVHAHVAKCFPQGRRWEALAAGSQPDTKQYTQHPLTEVVTDVVCTTYTTFSSQSLPFTQQHIQYHHYKINILLKADTMESLKSVLALKSKEGSSHVIHTI